jgi:hypothetical protein
MLVPLRFQSSSPSHPRDAFDMRLECHERIRRFAELACRAASQDRVPEEQRAEAFAGVERYFTMALPLHVEDEDVSLARLLRELELSEELRRGVEEMERQHREIEALVATLLPRWRLLREQPGRHEEFARELLADSERLKGLMEEHLGLEERLLFPEARARLSPASVAALSAEIQERRAGKP